MMTKVYGIFALLLYFSTLLFMVLGIFAPDEAAETNRFVFAILSYMMARHAEEITDERVEKGI